MEPSGHNSQSIQLLWRSTQHCQSMPRHWLYPMSPVCTFFKSYLFASYICQNKIGLVCRCPGIPASVKSITCLIAIPSPKRKNVRIQSQPVSLIATRAHARIALDWVHTYAHTQISPPSPIDILKAERTHIHHLFGAHLRWSGITTGIRCSIVARTRWWGYRW